MEPIIYKNKEYVPDKFLEISENLSNLAEPLPDPENLALERGALTTLPITDGISPDFQFERLTCNETFGTHLGMRTKHSLWMTRNPAEPLKAPSVFSFDDKLKSYYSYCDKKGFDYLVSERKIVAYLQEEIIPKHPKYVTVASIVTCLDSLYNRQKAYQEGIKDPKGPGLMSLIETVKRNQMIYNKKRYTGKRLSTILLGSQESEFLHFAEKPWRVEFHFQENYRTSLDFILRHYMLLDGRKRRAAQLSDLAIVDLGDQGSSEAKAVCLLVQKEKPDGYGRTELGAMVRNKDVRLCPVSKLAFYFFVRFTLDKEPFPKVNSPEWLTLPLLKGSNEDGTLDYTTQAYWLTSVENSFNKTPSFPSYFSPSIKAKVIELKDFTGAQVKESGIWELNGIENEYRKLMPLEWLKAMSGFDPTTNHNYNICRAGLVPPVELQMEIWPEIEEMEEEMADNPSSSFVASDSFLKLCKYLRICILQDAVILKKMFPDNIIFTHPIFRCRRFNDFGRSLEECLIPDDPQDILSILARPDVEDQLYELILNNKELQSQVSNLQTSMAIQNRQTISKLNEFKSEMVSFKSQFNRNIKRMNTRDSLLTVSLNNLTKMMDKLEKATVVTSNLIHTSSHSTSSNTPIQSFDFPKDPLDPPLYRMRRDIYSVAELWYEWFEGYAAFPDGTRLSITYLDNRYKNKWRNSGDIRVFYRRRKVIIDKTREIMKKCNWSQNQSVIFMDSQRLKYCGDKANKLNYFSQVIKSGKLEKAISKIVQNPERNSVSESSSSKSDTVIASNNSVSVMDTSDQRTTSGSKGKEKASSDNFDDDMDIDDDGDDNDDDDDDDDDDDKRRSWYIEDDLSKKVCGEKGAKDGTERLKIANLVKHS